MKVVLLLLLLFSSCSSDKRHFVLRHKNFQRDVESTYPNLSGNEFRLFANHIVDDTRVPFYPEKVKKGDIVFLKTKYIAKYVKYMHPKIRNPYILVTHFGDEDIPGDYACLLKDKKILAWFGMNATLIHPKLHPLPIGLDSNSLINTVLEVKTHPIAKERLLYLNFGATHPERMQVKDFFASKPYCTIQERLDRKDYYTEVMRSQFIISPRGNGIDCVRVWESVLLGTIPIVKTSPLDSLYEDLPILIVNDWTEINEEFLKEKYLEIISKPYNFEKLYMDYWLNQIKNVSR